MKKYFLFLFISLAFYSVSHAQISKGTVLLGGNLNFSERENNTPAYSETESSFLSVYPSFGFAIRDNTVAGLSLGYGRTKSNFPLNQKREEEHYHGGLFVRQYLALGKGFYLFGQATTGYNLSNIEEHMDTGKTTIRQNTVGVWVYPGLSYRVNKRILLEAGMGNLLGLNYRWSRERISYPTWERSSNTKSINFSTNADPQSNLYIGFRIALGK